MSSVQEHWFFDKSLFNDLDVGHAAIEQLMEALNLAGWQGSDLFRIQMAIEEAMVNAIEHGNKRDPDKKVRCIFEVTTEKVVMDITDQGCGFDHRNVADPTLDDRVDQPRGRGVMLIRELMSETHYNEIGNKITMIKFRSAPVVESEES